MNKRSTGSSTSSGAGHIAVIVLSYNNRKWLDRCLTTLFATDDDDFSVYFVDNASSDGSVEYVQQSFPRAHIVRNSMNLGFAGGNNEGLRAAFQAGADFAVLLNTDTWVEPKWLTEMRHIFQGDPSIAAATAMILCYDNDDFDRNFLQILEVTPGFIQDSWNRTVRPWYVTETGSGAALMARRSFFESVGVIDPMFFMYFEEIDLLRRGRFHGHKIAVSTRAIIHHYNHLESSGSGRPVKIRFERGYEIFTLKDHFNPVLKCVIKFLMEVVSRPIGAAFKGQWGRCLQLIKVGAELIVKSPWILWRRHLEIRDPSRLPEMAWLRKRGAHS
jgi:GT2 family glycosyltransferase